MGKGKKIWVFNGRVYKSEKSIKSVIECRNNSSAKVLVYELSETHEFLDFKKSLKAEKESLERDIKIRSITGDLSNEELSKFNLNTNICNFKEKLLTLNSNLEILKKNGNDFVRYLKNNKRTFLDLCNDVEYYKLLLKVYPFKQTYTYEIKWYRTEPYRKNIITWRMCEEDLVNFNKAKKELEGEKIRN
jgi:hypothetical protein